ncbi:hotdog fold thioesterase [Frankia sp. Cr1]|uniref:hotdog fold thioesterase n=1 Tax=Frankia sp. Cr1 TaxID=3073931 RepID=UPI002AD257A8|nr:hotdog fold thioesterase [Frankia sp. Cr1]
MTWVNGTAAGTEDGPGSPADAYGHHLVGLRTIEAQPGRAVVALDVSSCHLNHVGIAHGGAIFSLADQAVALAANLHGEIAVVSNATIHLLRPARAGDRLVATAEEDRRGTTLSLYTVRVTRGSELVALVTGQTATVGSARRRG